MAGWYREKYYRALTSDPGALEESSKPARLRVDDGDFKEIPP
jgi:hypothetical protein